MIQLATNIEGHGGYKVPFTGHFSRIYVEVASDTPVDVAVVTDEQLRTFLASDTGDDVEIDWEQNVMQYDFECRPLKRGREYLLIWNRHQDDPVTVAYKVTGIDSSAPPFPGDVRIPGQPATQPAG